MRASAARSLPLLVEAPSFDHRIEEQQVGPLTRGCVRTLQVNVGKLCNMACHHCHVDAGPKRTEIMPYEVAQRVVELLSRNPDVEIVDLTGGAPELNPHFRWLVRETCRLGRRASSTAAT